MVPHTPSRLALAVAITAALAGCGVGSGDSSEGTATLTVTSDYGAEPIAQASAEDPSDSETVLRFLDREAEIETRYGGGFVQTINGLSGSVEDGRNLDWFFFVNGIESAEGAADRPVRGGDKVWWDHRDWTDAMRVPAVVGSWPEPFVQSSAEEPLDVVVECAGERASCDAVIDRLSDVDVEAEPEPLGESDSEEAMRILVGPWEQVRTDGAAVLLDGGPSTSGVFAGFEEVGGAWELNGLDDHGVSSARLGVGGGLVAAVRDGEEPVTWLVTGVDDAGVAAAAEALDETSLADRFALIVGADTDATLPVPIQPEGEGAVEG